MAKAGKMAAAGDEEPVKSSEVLVLISASALKSLLTESDKYKEKIDGLVGELREEIGNAVEKKHLDKEAFALVKKFRRIKSVERKSSLYHIFQAYLDMSGEMKLIESVSGLPLDDDKPEKAEKPEKPEKIEKPEGDKPAGAAPKFGGAQARTEH